MLPRSESLRILDYTGQQRAASDPLRGYVDPNVPCHKQRTGTWYFGRVTFGTGRAVYGWVPERVATALPYDPQATPNKLAQGGTCTS